MLLAARQNLLLRMQSYKTNRNKSKSCKLSNYFLTLTGVGSSFDERTFDPFCEESVQRQTKKWTGNALFIAESTALFDFPVHTSVNRSSNRSHTKKDWIVRDVTNTFKSNVDASSFLK